MKKLLVTIFFALLVLAIPLSHGAINIEKKAETKSVESAHYILCHIYSEGNATEINKWEGIFFFNYTHLSIKYTSGSTKIGFLLPIASVTLNGSRTLDVWFFKGNLTISGGYVKVDGFAILAYCG